ncbi:hypothetical protein ACO0LD_23905 [Undibacterium sp. Ji83W]|uniref:hypothetical protein n=1 Tax=Undibacterium sp. Ji83W TaxID=3413043 RepID=UPI003BF41F8E
MARPKGPVLVDVAGATGPVFATDMVFIGSAGVTWDGADTVLAVASADFLQATRLAVVITRTMMQRWWSLFLCCIRL